jgi:2,3-dihydroxyethylbenzene 1,2-dioxygenase
MAEVTELGYLGLGVSDIEAWKSFAANILGLEVVPDSDKRCWLRMDYWHHRLFLEQDGTDDLCVLGFRVAGGEELRQMKRQLSDAGVAFIEGSSSDTDKRHVLELIKLTDPAGIPVEIFHGPQVQPSRPFHPGRPMHGRFKTGDGGLGHCMLRHSGLDKTYAFYRLLGMRGGVEYKVPLPGQNVLDVMFMHCNGRDHTVAFGPPSAKRINHVMFEADNLDDVGMTYEIVKEAKIPVAMDLGRHANDQMFSFYFVNPSGFMCEYGWGARAATHQSEYYARDTYGHQAQPGVMTPDMRPAKAAAQ